MDNLHLLKALFLGVIEGLTEFLPISSTGHLILIGGWIDFASGEARVFEVVIQFGAILAVMWIYRERIRQLVIGVSKGDADSRRFAAVVLVAFLPAAVIGALFIGPIKRYLFDPAVVSAALIIGGIIILLVERRTTPPRIQTMDQMTWRHGLAIGFAQCVAMIPGTSRSGATIIGGMLTGLSRQTATEFSFFLAMPTMLGAATYDAWKHQHLLNANELLAISVGFTAAFVTALVVVKALIRFIATHTLSVFAWYRIGLGGLIAVMLLTAAA
ncbi:MAG: undecaprenyl-diphosphate phosphatase [Rhodocyclaceae bacterium]|nr:undecaprenyl-diphosphate phosphatase [Rhodocyclaceae bacterium]MDZ4214938.1 undecaprenyl-diphosphate phosphatase [Rhodocyclaceae bacterium]